MSSTLSKVTNHQILQSVIIVAGCLFAAYAGNYIAEENYFPIAAALGGLLLIMFFFGLGSNVYLLIPICWGLNGQISALPLPFSVRQLVILLASVLFISGLIFKTGRHKAIFESIDLWIWINLFWLATTFSRNPVGVAALGGSERVGGKAYLDVLLGVMAYLMISRFRISEKDANRLPILILSIAAFTSFAGAVGLFAPGVGNLLSYFYSDFGSGTFSDEVDSTISAGATRFGFLLAIGLQLPLYIVCKTNPIKLILPHNIWRLLVYIIGIIMLFLTGFRNGVIQIFIITVVAALLREKWAGVAKIMLATCSVALISILISYTSIQLPYSFQRTLSFLPGNWDQEAVRDAKGSSEWRFEMWKIVLTTDKYIHNKMLGDGFGFLRADFEIAVDAMMRGTQAYEGENAAQETFMIDGDVHSGPVSSIRFVGYIGLVLFLPLLFMQAAYSYRVINASRGTPYEMLSLYLGIPSMTLPLIFIFVFGDFRTDFVIILFNVGMMKMIRSSVEGWKVLRYPQAGT